MEQRATGRFDNIRTVLDDLRASYMVAAEQLARGPSDRYALLRFEELVANASPSVDRLARFLGVPPSPALSRPTVGRLPAVSNSSFAGEARDAPLSPATRDRAGTLGHDVQLRLAVVVADAAAAVGYAVPA